MTSSRQKEEVRGLLEECLGLVEDLDMKLAQLKRKLSRVINQQGKE